MTKSSATTAATSKPAASSSAAAAAAAISAMLAFHACPVQAFQPSFLAPRALQMTSHAAFLNSAVPVETTMRCSSPWGGVRHRQRHRGGRMQPFRQGLERWPAAPRFGPMIVSPQGVLEDWAPLQVGDPDVSVTDDNYKLTFDLPTEVDEDGLDVSVSGRLLTVTARITREDSRRGGNSSAGGAAPGRGGWVTRSSQTDSVSRSFVLPEGVPTSRVTAAWIADGKVEIKFNKDTAPASTTTDTTTADGAAAAATPPPPTMNTATRDSKQASSVGDATTKTDAGNEPRPKTATASSSSEGYLSSLSSSSSSADKKTCVPPAQPAAEAQQTPADAATPVPASSSSAESDRRQQPRSTVFDAFDQEFGQFAKAMWGENLLGFPTEEQVEAAREARAKRVDAAREARDKKVSAIRRATMAVDIWETDENDGASYDVK